MPTKPLVHLAINEGKFFVEALREEAREFRLLTDIRTLKVFGNSFFSNICNSAHREANSYFGANDFINPKSYCIDPLNICFTSVMYAQINDEQYQRALPIEEKARQVARKERERRERGSYFPSGNADADAE